MLPGNFFCIAAVEDVAVFIADVAAGQIDRFRSQREAALQARRRAPCRDRQTPRTPAYSGWHKRAARVKVEKSRRRIVTVSASLVMLAICTGLRAGKLQVTQLAEHVAGLQSCRRRRECAFVRRFLSTTVHSRPAVRPVISIMPSFDRQALEAIGVDRRRRASRTGPVPRVSASPSEPKIRDWRSASPALAWIDLPIGVLIQRQRPGVRSPFRAGGGDRGDVGQGAEFDAAVRIALQQHVRPVRGIRDA